MHCRVIEPELLDSLPADHPDARHSRRDLRLINRLMGNHRWVAATAGRLIPPGGRVLELGAGSGDLLRRLWRDGRPADGLDVCPAPADLPAGARWWRQDLRRFAGYPAYDAVCGNLLFHQFTAEELAALGRRIRPHARLLLACEPARRRHARWLFRRLSPLLGANHVTCHDGGISIAAGFLRDELPRLLGLDAGQWAWRCATTVRGAYRMVAWRRPAP